LVTAMSLETIKSLMKENEELRAKLKEQSNK